jgi:hypothetical protein
MTEWSRLLSGAILGFMVGVISEPIKKALMKRYMARQYRAGLYKELITNFYLLVREFVNAFDLKSRERLSTSCYSAARSDPIVFQELRDTNWFNRVYDELNRVQTAESKEEFIKYARAFCNDIDAALHCNKTHRRYLKWFMKKSPEFYSVYYVTYTQNPDGTRDWFSGYWNTGSGGA